LSHVNEKGERGTEKRDQKKGETKKREWKSEKGMRKGTVIRIIFGMK
jgi:hypothetical protein